MRLTSSAFQHGEMIPRKYGMSFENVNPPLSIRDVPEGAKSLVLVMDDPDVPESAGVPVWDHWAVFDIPPNVTEIPEAWKPTGMRGKGTRGELNYMGPRPPGREHRYFFKLFALDVMLNLPEGSSMTEITKAMQGHIVAQAELMGRFAP